MDMRSLFKLPPQPLACSTKFLVARTPRRTLVLVVDDVEGIRMIPGELITDAAESLSFTDHLRGVARLEDGMALIYDLDALLSLDEEDQLDAAMAAETA